MDLDLVNGCRQRGEILLKDQADQGRDDISDERGNDSAERRADDDADGHVHNVALERERFKFIP